MGFIKAFTGALSGTFADQWLDYMMPAQNIPSTAAIFPAVKKSTNAGRGENTKGYENIITNGSRIVVPENTALITMQDGAITGCIAEPGGFTFTTDDKNSQSLFAGGGIIASTIGSAWEKFKFGGIPAAQQTAFYVNLNEIGNNNFGTQSEIQWYDTYCEAQLGAVLRGTYKIQIVDPISFIKNLASPQYTQPGSSIFDFSDIDNNKVNMLFEDVIGVLGSAVAKYVGDPKYRENNTPATGSMMNLIQQDQAGFGKAITAAIEEEKNWKTKYGIVITAVNIFAIEYSEESKQFLNQAREADVSISRDAKRVRAMGAAYGENLQVNMAAASAEAMKTAAANENGAMAGFMGFGMAQQQGAGMINAVAGMQPQQPMGYQQPIGYQQVQQPTASVETPVAPVEVSTTPVQTSSAPSGADKLIEMKKLVDAGIISQEEFEAAKQAYLRG